MVKYQFIMWQRLQTLYLAIASALIISLFFCDFATRVGGEGEIVDTWKYTDYLAWLLFLISLTSANVIALFSFKSRMLQMRVCVLAALILIGFQIWLGVEFFRYKNEMVFSLTAVFPIISAILDVLAARAIATDEAMVQASARLRSGKRKRK